MDLAEFLLARIAEDEQVAEQWPADRRPPPNGDALWMDALGHAIYQPRARVVAECEAKRQVLNLLAVAEAHLDETRRIAPEYRLVAAAAGPRDALQLAARYLTLPYADHPDYREEWKP